MTKLCLFILLFTWLSTAPSQAQVYRWVDKDGRVHFTDNPGRIPTDRVDQSRELKSDSVRQQPAVSSSPVSGTTSPAAGATASGASEAPTHLQRQQEELQAQIEAQDSMRQDYLEQLKSIRPIRTNPAFGSQRHQADQLGRSLAEVEHRLDDLRDELRRIELDLQQAQRQQQPGPASQSSVAGVAFDRNGHNRAYWQRRAAPLRDRVKQVQQRRERILQQLAAEPSGAYGRRGRTVLQLTQDLEQLEGARRAAETELQALHREAAKAGAPLAWLE